MNKNIYDFMEVKINSGPNQRTLLTKDGGSCFVLYADLLG
jgi:hypothetical protein